MLSGTAVQCNQCLFRFHPLEVINSQYLLYYYIILCFQLSLMYSQFTSLAACAQMLEMVLT